MASIDNQKRIEMYRTFALTFAVWDVTRRCIGLRVNNHMTKHRSDLCNNYYKVSSFGKNSELTATNIREAFLKINEHYLWYSLIGQARIYGYFHRFDKEDPILKIGGVTLKNQYYEISKIMFELITSITDGSITISKVYPAINQPILYMEKLNQNLEKVYNKNLSVIDQIMVLGNTYFNYIVDFAERRKFYRNLYRNHWNIGQNIFTVMHRVFERNNGFTDLLQQIVKPLGINMDVIEELISSGFDSMKKGTLLEHIQYKKKYHPSIKIDAGTSIKDPLLMTTEIQSTIKDNNEYNTVLDLVTVDEDREIRNRIYDEYLIINENYNLEDFAQHLNARKEVIGFELMRYVSSDKERQLSLPLDTNEELDANDINGDPIGVVDDENEIEHNYEGFTEEDAYNEDPSVLNDGAHKCFNKRYYLTLLINADQVERDMVQYSASIYDTSSNIVVFGVIDGTVINNRISVHYWNMDIDNESINKILNDMYYSYQKYLSGEPIEEELNVGASVVFYSGKRLTVKTAFIDEADQKGRECNCGCGCGCNKQ